VRIEVGDVAILVAWLWQGVALTLAVALLLRLPSRLSAATRHVVWWGTLGAVLALPIVGMVTTWASGVASPAGATAIGGFEPWTAGAVPAWAVAIAMGAWLGIVVLGLFRIVRGLLHLQYVAAHATPIPAEREGRLRLWAEVRRKGRPAAVCLSDRVTVPCAVGLAWALIVVPRRFMTTLSDDDLDQIVVHEHAHLLRRDDWWRLVQACVMAIGGLHPAVRWIGARIDLEREAACDDHVVARTGAARRYAACLADVACLAANPDPNASTGPVLAPGATHAGRTLHQRVVRLLDGRRNRAPRPGRAVLCVWLAGLVCAVHLLGQSAPLVVFVQPPDRAAAVAEAPTARHVALHPGIASKRQVTGRVSHEAVTVAPGAPWLAESGPNTEELAGARRRPARLRPAKSEPPADRTGDPTRFGRPFGPPVLTHEPGPARATSTGLEAPLAASPVAVFDPALALEIVAPPVGALDVRKILDAPRRRGWLAAAETGTAVGVRAKRAGLAAGGAVARAGQAIGQAF
jgi:beta-lactamase regulating signal transducer with metallopeptidase domain